jgi:hypothetical protein
MATNRERTQGKAKTHISREDRKAHKNAKVFEQSNEWEQFELDEYEQSLATYDDEPKDEETP